MKNTILNKSIFSHLFSHLRHKNVVQLVGVVFEDLSMKHIVLEFMSKVIKSTCALLF